MMLAFVVAVVAVVALLMIGNGGARERTFVYSVLPIARIVSVVLLAGTAAWFCVCRVKKRDESQRVITSTFVFIVALVLCLSMLLYTVIGVTLIIAAVIAVTIAAFVKYFYARDFYWLTILTAVQAACVVGARAAAGQVIWKTIASSVCIGLSFIIPVVVIIFFCIVKKNDGNFKFKGKDHKILKPGYLASPFFITAGLTLVGAVTAIAAPAIAIYAVFALLAAYLVFAIIYTVRMM